MRKFLPYGAALLKRNIQVLVGVLYSITNGSVRKITLLKKKIPGQYAA
jgi:hypothetical protein